MEEMKQWVDKRVNVAANLVSTLSIGSFGKASLMYSLATVLVALFVVQIFKRRIRAPSRPSTPDLEKKSAGKVKTGDRPPGGNDTMHPGLLI